MRRDSASRMRRSALVVATLSIVSVYLIVLTPGPAWAACGLLDTSCIAGTVEDTAGDTVDTVEDTVDETVDQVSTVVEETVDETADQVVAIVEDVGETVKQTTEKTVGTVEDTVDDTVGAVDPVVPPSPNGGPEQGSNYQAGNGSRSDTETSVVRPQMGGRSAPTLHVDLIAETSPAGDTVVVEGTSSTPPLDQPSSFAGSLPEIARTLAFPLVLVGLVLGFVAIQNRIDRRDPKLALASTTPDVLTFT